MLTLKEKKVVFIILNTWSGLICWMKLHLLDEVVFFTYSYLDLDNVPTCIVLDSAYWRCDWLKQEFGGIR